MKFFNKSSRNLHLFQNRLQNLLCTQNFLRFDPLDAGRSCKYFKTPHTSIIFSFFRCCFLKFKFKSTIMLTFLKTQSSTSLMFTLDCFIRGVVLEKEEGDERFNGSFKIFANEQRIWGIYVTSLVPGIKLPIHKSR